MYSKLGKYVSFTIDQYVINTRLTIYQFLSFHARKPSRRLVYIVSQNQYQIVKIIWIPIQIWYDYYTSNVCYNFHESWYQLLTFAFSFLEIDSSVTKLRELGEQKETLTRICHELPGYNWLEEKIRKSVTNDHPTTTTNPSSTASTKNEDGDDHGSHSLTPHCANPIEAHSGQR